MQEKTHAALNPCSANPTAARKPAPPAPTTSASKTWSTTAYPFVEYCRDCPRADCAVRAASCPNMMSSSCSTAVDQQVQTTLMHAGPAKVCSVAQSAVPFILCGACVQITADLDHRLRCRDLKVAEENLRHLNRTRTSEVHCHGHVCHSSVDCITLTMSACPVAILSNRSHDCEKLQDCAAAQYVQETSTFHSTQFTHAQRSHAGSRKWYRHVGSTARPPSRQHCSSAHAQVHQSQLDTFPCSWCAYLPHHALTASVKRCDGCIFAVHSMLHSPSCLQPRSACRGNEHEAAGGGLSAHLREGALGYQAGRQVRSLPCTM